MNNKPRLYSYVRWSSDRQATGTTLARQTESARLFAAEHDLVYVEILDAGVSAFKGKNSKQGALADFIAAVESGAIPSDSWLYVENLDRLSRADATTANELFLKLLRLGLTLVTGMDGKTFTLDSVNLNPTDLMLSILLFMRANEESRTKQKRVYGNVAALVERHNQGLPVNIKSAGSSPWWIDDRGSQYESVKPHPVHWSAGKKIVELLLEGWGCYRVATYLNERPEIYPPPRGNKGKGMKRKQSWVVANLTKMRRNRAMIGQKVITVNDMTYRLNDYFPSLCTETEFALMQDISQKNRIQQGAEKKVITLLSGLGVLRCGHCNGSMTFFSKLGKIRYVCQTGRNQNSDCGVWSVQGALVEALAIRAIIYGHSMQVMSGGTQAPSLEPQIEECKQRLISFDDRISNLTQAIAMGGNLSSLVTVLTGLEDEKTKTLLEIDRLAQQEALKGSDADVDERIQEIIGLMTVNLLNDSSHPDRMKIREIVRAVLPAVTISKSADKAIKVDFRFPDGSHLTFEGHMDDIEKAYRATWTMPDGTPTDEFYSRLTGLLKKTFTKVLGGTMGLEQTLVLEDRRLASIERLAEIHGLPALHGKHFFGKR
ncbi:UNVERIFIED_ORG: DNA invertase Pin-like site-specific DNA recombinase [Pantoea agglomerans]